MALLATLSSPIGLPYPSQALNSPLPAPRQFYGVHEPLLQTARLRLRRWESRDVTPFVTLCSDPAIMQYFNGVLSPLACFEEMERQEACFDAYRYGVWAVELKATGEFVGCVGLDATMLAPKDMTARMTWKLKRDYWSMNYAYEAAMEVMDYAFHELDVKEVIAIVHPGNLRSRQLVQRLGLLKHEKDENCFYKTAP